MLKNKFLRVCKTEDKQRFTLPLQDLECLLGEGTYYLHERPSVLGILAAVLLIDLIGMVGWSLDWYSLLYFLIMWPTGPAFLAVFILSIQKALAGVRRELVYVPPPELPMKRFVTFALASSLNQ